MEDENSSTSKICRGTCSVLEYLISRNASAPRVKSHFHSNSAPPIPIVAYVQRIVKHAYCSDEAFIGALMFLAYHCAVTNHPITTYNVHRIYFTAVVIAIKCRDDHYRSNVYYAQVGGLTRQKSEVGTLETEFLSTIGWDAWMDEQIYMQTYTMVEQLSDLPASPSEDDMDEIAQAVDYWESKLFASFQERRDGLNKRLREDMIAVAANQQRNRSLTGSPTTPNTRTSLAAVAGAPSFYPAGQRPGGSGTAIPSGAPHSVTGGSLLRRPNPTGQYTAEEQQQFGTIGQMSCDSALHNKFAVGDIIRVDKEAPVHYGGNNNRGGSVGGTGAAEEDEDTNNNSGNNQMSTPTSGFQTNTNNSNNRRSGGTPASETISCGMYIPRRSTNTVTSTSYGSDTSATGSPIKVTGNNTASAFRGASNTTRTYSSSGHASPLANQDRGLSTELYIQRKTKKRTTPVQAETAGDGPNTPNDGSNSRDPSFTSTPTSTNTAANNMAFPNTAAAFIGGAVSTVKVSARDGSVGTEMGGTSSFQGSPTEASNRQFPSVSRSTVAVTEIDSKRSSLQNKQYGFNNSGRGGVAEEGGGTGTPLTYNDDGRAGSNSTIANRRGNAPSHLTRSFSPDIVPQGVPASANTPTTGYNALSPNKPPLGGGSPSSFGAAGSGSGFNTTAPKGGGRNRMATKHRFSSASLCATPDGRNPIGSADSSAGAGDRYAVMGATNQRFASYHEYPSASHHVDPSGGGAPGVRLTSMPQSSSHNEDGGGGGALAPRTEATKGMPERFLQVATGTSSRNLNGLRSGGSLERGEEEEGEADRFASTSPNIADGWRTSASRNSNSQQPSSGTAGGGGGQRGGAVRGRRAGAVSGHAAEGKKRAKNPAWAQDE